ncbi:hypothetical protein FJ567_00365 [Mesorhizobium sp. B2-4-16]|nr:hypothetical protein FJ567_00365 [Mesorhizobium sp. B2-4-16]TPL75336.1 hypothetical protein FJ956_05850 [Mesorhizobium sp. B2-4-3]
MFLMVSVLVAGCSQTTTSAPESRAAVPAAGEAAAVAAGAQPDFGDQTFGEGSGVPKNPASAKLYADAVARGRACREQVYQSLRAQQGLATASSVIAGLAGPAGQAAQLLRRGVGGGLMLQNQARMFTC